MEEAQLVRRALVVDDTADINRIVQIRLRARGFEVNFAADGEEALKKIAELPPDVLFLDISMPGISGLDVLDEVRRQQLDLAVIMMTAYGSEDVAIEALRRGADDYLRKPFASTEFNTTLDRTVTRLELSRQNTALRKQLDEKRRQLEAELQRAAVVQAELLPAGPPSIPGFEVAARCYPAREVGGDFYDWVQIEPGRYAFTLGDVMGKGMPAALLMATARAVMRAAQSSNRPAEAVSLAGTSLETDLDRSGSFVTLFHAQLDAPSHRLSYVDAGHGHGFLLHEDGSCMRLQAGGLPLGVLREPYEEGCIIMSPGDALVLYSDGLVDAQPALQLDAETIAARVRGMKGANEIADGLVAVAGDPLQYPDDLTVLVIACIA